MTVTYDYTGRAVLVTGGTQGIGAGIARAFREAGADVTVCARREPAAPAPGIRFARADVRVAEDVERLMSGFDRLDVVVNNAGGSPYAPLDGTSPRLHARVVELNLTAPLLVSQFAYPLLAAGGGAIVMIGSASGARPSPGTSAYGAAKAGLHHLARCLAAEWAPEVRVNTVVVGLADTENAASHYGGQEDGMGAAIPAGRMATPADVAAACLWLAAPGYVTGAEVRVDGGGEIPAWRHLASGDIS
ncbi:SDR family oxidoreductase [Nonomuraea angiospora]|uniref:NAD(P)-dependent dehydrogenase (Short-subunit alcohol dehydrogenase family) n=1 Tax=Nonomuraea angiospora TaxID=46172 RepID=A0ABR9ME53_9ACTN|nr:SDR family oxidoreductase [Nonomuraea angiospora]MBE1591197.1 NAD(P)-dependent dehydrogenase (short-subunit alcohol dehydrogenase family) [Nonomuraea angiospora]